MYLSYYHYQWCRGRWGRGRSLPLNFCLLENKFSFCILHCFINRQRVCFMLTCNLSAFWSEISLCRQMYTDEYISDYFSRRAIGEFKVLNTKIFSCLWENSTSSPSPTFWTHDAAGKNRIDLSYSQSTRTPFYSEQFTGATYLNIDLW